LRSMSHLSASRIKIGGALILAAAVPVAIWLVTRSSAPERSDERDRRLLRELADKYPPYHDEHGDHTPRSKDDPKNGHIRGCVTRAGKPVPGAKLTAIVWPTGMSFTVDSAVAGPDGCYEILITAKHLQRKQVAEVYVERPLVGRLLVPVAPGETTAQADLEVGAGLVIRGVVRDEKGAAVARVLVTDGRDRFDGGDVRTDEAGRFAIRIDKTGRVQLHTPEYEGNEAVVFDVTRLDGQVNGVVLTVGAEVVRPASSHERHVAGATAYTIKPVSLQPGANIYGGWCTAWARRENGELEATVTDSGFELDLTQANVRITCDQMQGFVDNGRDIDVSRMSSPIEMPAVPIELNGVELGVELRAHPLGARVVGVAGEAKTAGLQAGDVVVAIDDVPVAGFDHRSVYELGFRIPPGHEVSWTIERDGARTKLHATAPGSSQPALYMY
jgi:hypothetical protein